MVLLGGAYFGQIFCFKNQSKNKNSEILLQNSSSCLIFISLLYENMQELVCFKKPKQKLKSKILVWNYSSCLIFISLLYITITVYEARERQQDIVLCGLHAWPCSLFETDLGENMHTHTSPLSPFIVKRWK